MSEPFDYTFMGKSELAAACGDDPAKWAEAFTQNLRSPRAETVARWFSMAIDTAVEVRKRRAREDELRRMRAATLEEQKRRGHAAGRTSSVRAAARRAVRSRP